MNNRLRMSVFQIILAVLIAMRIPDASIAGDINADGVDDGIVFVDENKDYIHDHLPSRELVGDVESVNSIVISSNTGPRAFIGFYIFQSLTGEGIQLLIQTIDKAASLPETSRARMLLFTYNNDLELPVTYQQEDGYALYTWLNETGYFEITALPQWDLVDLSLDYFREFDFVLYWNTYGYDPTTVIASEVPFISNSIMHALDMNLVDSVAQQFRSDFCVVNADFHPILGLSSGEVQLTHNVWVNGGNLADDGVALITDVCIATPVKSTSLGTLKSLYR